MTDPQLELDRLIKLRKSAVLKKNFNTDGSTKRLKQIAEEMDYFKKRLFLATQTADSEKIEQYLLKLINLRAEQTSLNLYKNGEEEESVDDDVIKDELNKYYQDCSLLILKIEKYLAK